MSSTFNKPVLRGKFPSNVPLAALLKLNSLLNKSIFSRKFYQEINDKVLSSTATVDRNLYFICYFTLLLSSVLNNKPQIKAFLAKQRYNFVRLINSSFRNYLGTDLSKSSNKFWASTFDETPPPPPPTLVADSTKEPVSKLAVHLKAISSYLSDIRIFARLTDSIKYVPWIIDEYRALVTPGHKVPKFDRVVNLLQALNCLLLEFLENAGWLTEHNWVGTNDNDWWCMETYIWCSRVWGVYLLVEIIELFRRVPVSKWDKNWRINVFKQVVQMPLVLHWSLYEGCLTPFWVGLCGSGASWWDFKDLWGSIDLS
ncbi:hypothetical protein CAAN1_25S00122 [[Candida] anglica]|uniref:Uncharacterized protein n=1 Tax=[Candida] anglica TaxID=148631 RepID=A0ABP0EDC6_9ASCO